VLDESPQNQVALNNVAYLLGPRLHRYDEAVSYSARVVAAHPDIPDFLDTHALVLLGLNRTREAEETARAAQRLRPEDPGILLTLSSVLLKSGGSTVEARQMLERARDLLNAAPVRNRHLEERLAALEQELSSGT
jgi:predicted Zn-dependent protease